MNYIIRLIRLVQASPSEAIPINVNVCFEKKVSMVEYYRNIVLFADVSYVAAALIIGEDSEFQTTCYIDSGTD